MTNSVEEVKKGLDDLADMQFVRDKRKEIISKITADGIPGDLKIQQVLLGALTDMDRSALARTRIKSEEGNTDKMVAAGLVVTELLRKTKPREFEVEAKVIDLRDLPSLPSNVPHGTYHEGVMQQGTHNTTFDEFIASRAE